MERDCLLPILVIPLWKFPRKLGDTTLSYVRSRFPELQFQMISAEIPLNSRSLRSTWICLTKKIGWVSYSDKAKDSAKVSSWHNFEKTSGKPLGPL